MKPSAIISADEHLRENIPIARIDDYWKAQSKKVEFLWNLQKDLNNIPILSGGDLFDKTRVSPFLESWAIKNLPYIITVPGNHELPNHNLENLPKSSLSVLGSAKTIEILEKGYLKYEKNKNQFLIAGFPWGTEPSPINKDFLHLDMKKIAICHYLVYEKDNTFPDLVATKALSLLKKMKGFDLIITGHNHIPFAIRHKNRLLVNPGSMMRMFADQLYHKPVVYLWYSQNNTVEPIYYPIEPSKKVLTREHIEIKKKKDEKMQSFVAKLNSDPDQISLSFENNLEIFFKQNKIRKSTEELVWEAVR